MLVPTVSACSSLGRSVRDAVLSAAVDSGSSPDTWRGSDQSLRKPKTVSDRVCRSAFMSHLQLPAMPKRAKRSVVARLAADHPLVICAASRSAAFDELRIPEGYGANSQQEQSLPCRAVQTLGLEHRVPDCRRSSALNAQRSQSELSLADAMHQLDADDRDRRIPEFLEPEHHGDALLHAPMVLLNQVVQVF